MSKRRLKRHRIGSEILERAGKADMDVPGPPGEHEFDEGKLHNAAGQTWNSERMDRINDEKIDHLQIDKMILQESGERKHHRKKIVI